MSEDNFDEKEKEHIVEQVAFQVANEQPTDYDTTFTPGDVALAWITALRSAVVRGKLTEETFDEISTDAADFTAQYAFKRKEYTNTGRSH